MRKYYESYSEDYERGYLAGKKAALQEGLHYRPKDSKEVEENRAIKAKGRKILNQYGIGENERIRIEISITDKAGHDHKASLIIRPFYLGYFEYSFYVDTFCFGIEQSYSKFKSPQIDSNKTIKNALITTFEKKYPKLVKFIEEYDF